MSKVLNRAQAMTLLANIEPTAEAELLVTEIKTYGEHATPDVVMARFGQDTAREWVDNCGTEVVYGD